MSLGLLLEGENLLSNVSPLTLSTIFIISFSCLMCCFAHAGGGPMSLRLLLEGESLLNDASSITLFTIFLSEVKDYRAGITANGGQVLGSIVSQMLLLAVGEFLKISISQTVPNTSLHLSPVHIGACRTQKYDVRCRMYSLCEREVCCYCETGRASLMACHQGPHLALDLATGTTLAHAGYPA